VTAAPPAESPISLQLDLAFMDDDLEDAILDMNLPLAQQIVLGAILIVEGRMGGVWPEGLRRRLPTLTRAMEHQVEAWRRMGLR